MLFPDYHFHTDFSSDCDEPMQAVIASAKEKACLPSALQIIMTWIFRSGLRNRTWILI